ncbi:YeeE/YedE family protein [Xinfangfangia sp. D13-10-4-6]|uniref:YeeE/YedE family protein n=1 Tax=Pseudogemmobacter hezensis TaxID=2737662 RepID=UPI00155537CA|nr:YeeE/YedE family protein [Pseudogemmobacter hezensis]NPD14203.1 YeeE/YedE family protein [Pseudogemmobacter hezensis]
MTEFTPWSSLAGGALIGLAAVLLMALHGRIMGVTGILSGMLPGAAAGGGRGWRLAFLAGAVLAPLFLTRAFGLEVGFDSPVSWAAVAVSGFLVGMGVTWGGGCTSGHGICGNARLSPRSLVATLTFMATATLTVWVIRHLIGGI